MPAILASFPSSHAHRWPWAGALALGLAAAVIGGLARAGTPEHEAPVEAPAGTGDASSPPAAAPAEPDRPSAEPDARDAGTEAPAPPDARPERTARPKPGPTGPPPAAKPQGGDPKKRAKAKKEEAEKKRAKANKEEAEKKRAKANKEEAEKKRAKAKKEEAEKNAAKPSEATAKKPRAPKGCPPEMAFVQGRFCIDRYEAHVVEIGESGREKPHSPFEPVAGVKVKARSAAGKIPQGYISRDEAAEACRHAGKRLCTGEEWLLACKGKRPTQFPYGDERQPGRCNDQGLSSFNKLFGSEGAPPTQALYTWDNLNDPRLNRMPGTLAPAGKHKRCRNSYGLYDMVGNLHEWTAAAGGTFRGGYYLDVEQNGLGCDYRTSAHNTRYHDYSTGFRCCK